MSALDQWAIAILCATGFVSLVLGPRTSGDAASQQGTASDAFSYQRIDRKAKALNAQRRRVSLVDWSFSVRRRLGRFARSGAGNRAQSIDASFGEDRIEPSGRIG